LKECYAIIIDGLNSLQKLTSGDIMRSEKHYLRMWKLLQFLGHRFVVTKFNFKHDRYISDKPCLIISNHVTNWDPILVAMSFPKNNIHFVASEHLFRMGFVSKLINFLVAPIARRKGSSGLDAAMNSLRTIKAGGTVGLFAEGECTWDGKSVDIFSATGTLAKASGAPLVTYRLEGGYFTMPRWNAGQRRGKMYGHVVNVYQPEELKKMRPEEVAAIINRDIYEDAQERQKTEKQRFRSRKRAEALESMLCLCPKCRKVGGMKSKGIYLSCECGHKVEFTEYGVFQPAEPFETIGEWDKWQNEIIVSGDFEHGEEMFADENIMLNTVDDDHNVQTLHTGRLCLKDGALHIGGREFRLDKIHNMGIVRTNRLFFNYDDVYYELRSKELLCLRKYRIVWLTANGQN